MVHDSYDTIIMWSSFRQMCVLVYTVLIVSLIVTVFIRSSMFVTVFMGPSINLHQKMFNSIIGTTMLFFNTNSSGNNNKIKIILLFKLYTIYLFRTNF